MELLKGVIFGVGGCAVLALVFSLGVAVGARRAEFSFKWAEAYHQNFGGPIGGIFGEFMGMDGEMANTNGCFGKIMKVESTDGQEGTLTVMEADNIEKSILVDNATTIVCQRQNLKISDLKVGDTIVVIGEPNDNGQIQAQFIRMMPIYGNTTIKILRIYPTIVHEN